MPMRRKSDREETPEENGIWLQLGTPDNGMSL